MLEKFIDKIVDKQVKNKMMSEDEINIYRYGYFLMFEVVMNIIISILIGIIFKDIKTIIIFLAMYIPIRTYSGGWHADKLWKCTVISNVMLIVIELLVKYCGKYYSNHDMAVRLIVLLFICVIYICIVSPVDTKEKPLNSKEKKVYRRKLIKIIVFEMCILIVFIINNARKCIFITEYTYFMQTIMLILEKNKEKNQGR